MRYAEARSLPEELLGRAREVYEDAFPEHLSAPFETLFADRVHAYVDEPATEVHGLVVTRPLGDTGWVFLRYFVAATRGAGTGSRMWADLPSIADGATRIVLDVEHPDEPGTDADEVTIRRRRIVFYERLGARVLPVDDYAPPHDDGHASPLLLLAGQLDGTEASWVDDQADVRRVLLATYLHRYGFAADAPVVARALAASGL